MRREKTFIGFLAQRVITRRLFGWIHYKRRYQTTQATGPSAQTEAEAEIYDQWLLNYLDNVAQRYTPKEYPGKLALLFSAQEPRGLLLDCEMGWGAFTKMGIDVAEIEGDHFTVFDGHGLEQIASYILSTSVSSGISSSIRGSNSSGISSGFSADAASVAPIADCAKKCGERQFPVIAYVNEQKQQANTDTVNPIAE